MTNLAASDNDLDNFLARENLSTKRALHDPSQGFMQAYGHFYFHVIFGIITIYIQKVKESSIYVKGVPKVQCGRGNGPKTYDKAHVDDALFFLTIMHGVCAALLISARILELVCPKLQLHNLFQVITVPVYQFAILHSFNESVKFEE